MTKLFMEINRRNFLTGGIAGITGILLGNLNEVKANGPRKSGLFLTPYVVNLKRAIPFYGRVNKIFWSAFRDFNPQDLNVHGADYIFYYRDLTTEHFKHQLTPMEREQQNIQSRLLNEKYDCLFLPILEHGMNRKIYSFIDVHSVKVPFQKFFLTKNNGGRIRLSQEESFGFDISELAYKSFWSDSFEAMGDYLRGSA